MIDGWFYRCPQSHFIPRVLDEEVGSQNADGILIEDTPAFRQRLLAYLQSAEVLVPVRTVWVVRADLKRMHKSNVLTFVIGKALQLKISSNLS